jgi:hypothetical protein
MQDPRRYVLAGGTSWFEREGRTHLLRSRAA